MAEPPTFSVGVSERTTFSLERLDGTRSTRLRGEIDLAVYEEALAEVLDAFRGPGDASLDLSELTFMDSTGIRLLIQLRRSLDPEYRIILRSPSPMVRKVLEVVGMTSLGFELAD
jgi:anti-sigma B factor antagonist